MNLFEKLLEMQKRVDGLIKDGKNTSDKYDFASDENVLDRFRPMMDELGLLLVPAVRDARVHEGTTRSGTARFLTEVFYTMTWRDVESGETLEVPWYAQGVDLAGEKGVGKAATYAEKYFLLGAIQGQLVKHGAKKIMQDYDDEGRIAALSFLVDTPTGPRGIRLPANVDAVHAVLLRQKVKCDREQAERVAWRIVKDWVEAKMAILESEMVQMDEIFLPYMLNRTGQTVFEAYRNNQLALEGGAGEEDKRWND